MESKKGDTLVEVAFAIGIFSLVAITVVAVISASTSAAQAALETTLTREDIDGQAEALRFIHDSYVSGTQSAAMEVDNPYYQLWNTIRGFAYKNTDAAKKYNPSTCSELYNNGWVKTADPSPTQNLNARPFIINIRQLHNPRLDNRDNVIKYNNDASGDRTNGTAGPFTEAETYPRILYNGATTEDLYTQTQIGNNTIYRVEGLYVIAVEGQSVNVNPASVTGTSVPAYYDFYIRSCWMPTNSDRPSTISTLVRLYDPAVISHKII